MKIIKLGIFLCGLMIGTQSFSQQILPKEKPAKKKLVLFKDSDGDGIFDSRDKCPDIPGTRALQGCPDTDGDGIADKDDKCKDIPGLEKYFGCPVPDTDGDGIIDEEDQCKTIKGTIENKGCPATEPDADGDGVIDKEDECPAEKGTAANKGCPVKEVIENKPAIDSPDSVTYRIYFDYDVDQISADGFKVLKHIVDILKGENELKVKISGHDDNISIPSVNLKKSADRAKLVKDYFMSYYISESRIISNFYGAAIPIDENQQWLNRRVEITLYK
ncbi:MAG: OmpA family protein [Chitinophagaceae bacterium]|nr:OmpA family protein [Chitinophagaceae bacterium]